ncbi:hypothetical protein F383_37166 [Gossypium arboreum]|uniref:Uncharacterized protein n=1 Tax=Gossypium arboreum TaxID=29729 RepID=A0A0B0MC34_GOSAR|nr:hypothetical protein F383_37166 [Gossypium arboreum]
MYWRHNLSVSSSTSNMILRNLSENHFSDKIFGDENP